MGVNGKIVKCSISWKRLIVEQNRWKFGTRGSTVHICRVLLMPDSLHLVWGHSVHFARFPMLRFSKCYSSPSFHSTSTKFYCKYVGHKGFQSVTFFGNLPKFKNFMVHWNISQHRTMGLEISKRFSSYIFHLMSPKLYEDISYHGTGYHFSWESVKF